MRPWGDPTGCVLFVFITHFCLWFLLLKAPDSSEDSAHGKKCCAGGSGPPLLHLSALGEAPAPTRRLIHPRLAAIAHTAPILSAAPSVWQASASGRAPATAPADARTTTSERGAARWSAAPSLARPAELARVGYWGSPLQGALLRAGAARPAPLLRGGRPATGLHASDDNPELAGNGKWMSQPEGFGAMMWPLVRSGAATPDEKPYQRSEVGFLRMLEPFIKQYDFAREAMRKGLTEATWQKTNPFGMEAMQTLSDLAAPGHAPASGGGVQSPNWDVTARAVKAGEPFLRRLLIIRQLFGDPPYSDAIGPVWMGHDLFRSIDVAKLGASIGSLFSWLLSPILTPLMMMIAPTFIGSTIALLTGHPLEKPPEYFDPALGPPA